MIWTREKLIEHIASPDTASVDFLFFWGHTQKNEGVTDASCLSQWFPATFVIDGITYKTAEHFMMAEKARLFKDNAALAKILKCKSPAEAKAFGREVANYDDRAWGRTRSLAVVQGNVAKFAQNPLTMGAFLRSTKKKVLVEASPRDRIWGIGMGGSNPDARDPKKWKGQNLLGFALMEARRELFETSA
jgi:ribA/ribD-fused uncharacterized protein